MAPHTAVKETGRTALHPELTFDRIYQEYRPRIHRYLTRLLGPADADDVTQMVFVRAGQALPEFRRDSSIGTWLYRLARNAAVDWRRSRIRAVAIEGAAAVQLAGGGTARDDRALPADAALVRRELQQCVRSMIAQLPGPDREVLTLRELEGLSNTVIANALGLRPETVKVRLHRARGRLREAVTSCCTFSPEGEGLGCESKEGVACCTK